MAAGTLSATLLGHRIFLTRQGHHRLWKGTGRVCDFQNKRYDDRVRSIDHIL